jgi:hypothetical protein
MITLTTHVHKMDQQSKKPGMMRALLGSARQEAEAERLLKLRNLGPAWATQ